MSQQNIPAVFVTRGELEAYGAAKLRSEVRHRIADDHSYDEVRNHLAKVIADKLVIMSMQGNKKYASIHQFVEWYAHANSRIAEETNKVLGNTPNASEVLRILISERNTIACRLADLAETISLEIIRGTRD